MRILHVVPTYFPAVRYGGTIRTVHGLAAALAARGHEVHVYTTSVDGANDIELPAGQIVERDRVFVHYFKVPALRRLYWSPTLGAELKKMVQGFDVVHLHSIYLWPTWAAARDAEKAGVPYVVSPHGMLIRELIRRKSRWIKSAWIQMIERKSLSQAAAVHVTADLEGGEAQALGVDPRKTHKILHGVDWPNEHAPLSSGPFANVAKPYALFLSRINWKKGLDRLLVAWKSVPNLPLLIVGNDDEGYTDKLKEIANSEGVGDRVHFLGPADDINKWALYENATLFVLPSYSENFGVVVAEAMVMSCPVVITPEVGISELVRAADAGIVVSGEPIDLAQAIRLLLADPERRLELGRRGRRLVLDSLSWDAAAEQTEVLYRRIICDRRADRI